MVDFNRREDMKKPIDELSKCELKNQILGFNGKIHLDFTENYLEGLSIDKLRHILVAAMSL